MTKLLRSYLGIHDTASFITHACIGYVRTKLTLAKFGPFPVVRGRVRFQIRGEAVFGERFTALADTWDVRIFVGRGGKLTVGDRVAMNAGVSIEVWHDVRIGDYVMMAPFVSVIDDDRHELEPGTPLYKGPTVIGNNVWLASNVMVLPGVSIGSGSVIGANSVVSRNIPPNSFAAGAPAKVIRSLNVPDEWSHRYGYQQTQPGNGLLAMVRRTFAQQSGTSAQPTTEVPANEVPATDAPRDHEAIEAQLRD